MECQQVEAAVLELDSLTGSWWFGLKLNLIVSSSVCDSGTEVEQPVSWFVSGESGEGAELCHTYKQVEFHSRPLIRCWKQLVQQLSLVSVCDHESEKSEELVPVR